MKLYTKNDSDFTRRREGVIYTEFVDNVATRQVSICEDVWVWADSEHRNGLTDQPYSVFKFEASEHITSEEFERVWAEALSREQSTSYCNLFEN